MLITSASLGAMTTGFKTIFNQAYAGAESQCDQIAMRVPSSTREETYGWLGKTTRFREWVGDRVLQNLSAHGYSIKNKSFENTVTVDRDDIEDDKIGVYTPIMQQLGYDAKTHPDELAFGLLKQGTSSVCYDGQYFFDTDHPVIGENGAVGSVSNWGGGSGPQWYVLDTSRPIKPVILQNRRDYAFVAMDQATDEAVFNRKEYRYGVDGRLNVGFGLWQMAYGSAQDLTPDTYAAALAALQSMKGDQGKPLGIKPTLLVVPPSLGKAAKTIVKAETIDGTTNVNRDATEILVSPWLA
jgi:phage major head subunit gpT-like protein